MGDSVNRKRNFLKTDEVIQIVMITGLVTRLEEMIDSWKKHEMIANDEAKWMRTAATMTAKAINSILDSFSEVEIVRIQQRIADTDYIIKDKTFYNAVVKLMQKDHAAQLAYVEDMKDIGSELMYYTCKGCTQDHKDCMWHDIFYKYVFGESEENFPNCRYAYENKYVNEGLRKTTNVVDCKGLRNVERGKRQGNNNKNSKAHNPIKNKKK